MPKEGIIFVLFSNSVLYCGSKTVCGWSGGAMVNFQCRGVLQFRITVGQGLTALAVGAGGGCLDIFTLTCPFFPIFPSLWETARYRLIWLVGCFWA